MMPCRSLSQLLNMWKEGLFAACRGGVLCLVPLQGLCEPNLLCHRSPSLRSLVAVPRSPRSQACHLPTAVTKPEFYLDIVMWSCRCEGDLVRLCSSGVFFAALPREDHCSCCRGLPCARRGEVPLRNWPKLTHTTPPLPPPPHPTAEYLTLSLWSIVGKQLWSQYVAVRKPFAPHQGALVGTCPSCCHYETLKPEIDELAFLLVAAKELLSHFLISAIQNRSSQKQGKKIQRPILLGVKLGTFLPREGFPSTDRPSLKLVATGRWRTIDGAREEAHTPAVLPLKNRGVQLRKKEKRSGSFSSFCCQPEVFHPTGVAPPT